MRPTTLLATVLVTLAAVAPATAAGASPPQRSPGRIASTISLGGGLEAGSSSNGVAEMELTLGYELGDVRPELGIVLGLEPNSHAALRPGARVDIAHLPAYGRAALDLGNSRDGWKVRWVMLGAGAEARITSEMGVFAEADVGLPMASRFGLLLLARAGFSLRF